MEQSRADDFREFATARTGHLFRSACLLTSGDTHLAEDLVQETLSRMYAAWGRMPMVDNPAAYSQSVLVRQFLSHRRRRSASERPVADLPDGAAPPGSAPETRVSLLRALGDLSPKDRAVVVLRYWEDRSIEETAAAMNTSTAAVRTRSTRALAKLRSRLGESFNDLASL
ncbi:SigE family RNA polymerase sigma factor [Streptomyces sp. MBT49]|uniref:SigE family RNA polymerase sigma factor n=1 Tax=Streptomyces TaxID=1883 RepID=UPI00190A9A0B|nr:MULTISPECIES: SigE family RNA polymerase sigma factor [unclassified Streptomyces]MBK3629619.1 SigE family RNA polymerase sigma factor [Streptomyces sp. MBT49]MBK3635160.1 SigE family RNA polymerase sigma factor [Streptomyces sp. MBT97]